MYMRLFSLSPLAIFNHNLLTFLFLPPHPPTPTPIQGWEARRDPQGRIYYVDHNTRSTTWRRPTAETAVEQARYMASQANLAQMLQQFSNRTLSTASVAPATDDSLGPLPSGRAFT